MPRDALVGSRRAAERILRAGVAAADPRAAVRQALLRAGDAVEVGGHRSELPATGRLLATGAGKAAVAMAAGLVDVLGDRLSGGALVTPHGYAPARAALPPGLDVWEARHPIPDTHGLAAAAAALELARSAADDDLVVCLLSGGASALWPAPPAGVTLVDLQRVTERLLRSGAPIGELNTVRRHLSRLGGGQLARAVHPARLLTLVISDVVGSPLEVIASGPTVPDPTTFADALEILARRRIDVPAAVLAHLRAGAAGTIPDTPAPGDRAFERATTRIVLENRDALDAATACAEQLGFRARILSDRLEGEAAEAGRRLAGEALRAQAGMDAGGPPLALLAGGETTVTVRGAGRGGRNQELALAAAVELADHPGVVLASLATDGVDGPTAAAGAVVDGTTADRGHAAGADPRQALSDNDSHRFLEAAGGLLVTGATGTNVNDLMVVLVDPPAPAKNG